MGRDDLAIGAYNEDIGSIANAGAVHVIYGSSEGLSATNVLENQKWTQNSDNIQDSAENNNNFSMPLSSGDYNGDGCDDLAIGVVGEDINFALDAGTVHIIYGSTGGLSATAVLIDQQWIQGLNNLEDNAEFLDYFGWSF